MQQAALLNGLGFDLLSSLEDVVPVRSPDKAKETLSEVDGDVVTAPMDLADIGSVRAFASEILGARSQLDPLINNTGIMACPEARVGPGWESQFGVNHMGHFALTKALIDDQPNRGLDHVC